MESPSSVVLLTVIRSVGPSSSSMSCVLCPLGAVCIACPRIRFICGTCGHPSVSQATHTQSDGWWLSYIIIRFRSGVDYLRLNRHRGKQLDTLPGKESLMEKYRCVYGHSMCAKYQMDKSLNKWEGNCAQVWATSCKTVNIADWKSESGKQISMFVGYSSFLI